ncbi:MAG: type II toxin-antitoxin system RelE/ParE family toxin [Candidatus Hydrogenedentes bacterium]|nr:type II toxin-antitoxin system RelE/ParE family toxin [Candidatus Hydrogenedentota bacterium]
MNVEILDEARTDLIDGFHFYESQVPGLGDYFLESLFSDIESLRLYAGIHPIVYRYHRLLAKRFPFAIYYALHGNIARVIAILACRQDPEKAQSRLA